MRYRMIAHAWREEDGSWRGQVGPNKIDEHDPFHRVAETHNAIIFKSETVGEVYPRARARAALKWATRCCWICCPFTCPELRAGSAAAPDPDRNPQIVHDVHGNGRAQRPGPGADRRQHQSHYEGHDTVSGQSPLHEEVQEGEQRVAGRMPITGCKAPRKSISSAADATTATNSQGTDGTAATARKISGSSRLAEPRPLFVKERAGPGGEQSQQRG